MISTGIRNMGLYDKVSIDNGANEDSSGAAKNCGKSKLPHIINDRKFLKFLSSHNGREVVYKNGAKGLDTSVSNHPDMKPITQVQSNTTVTKAAELMMDIRTPCLISKGNKGEEKPIIT